MAYNSIHKFGIKLLPEAYLNSETLSNDENLNVPGYNLIRSDHLSNTKRGEGLDLLQGISTIKII